MSPTSNLTDTPTDANNVYFDRQQRIGWWDQSRLFNARILVVGAGALGNEVLKNLALLGVGHIWVVDYDTIEDTNLSRTVLFRVADVNLGASKAITAAARAKALNPNANAVVKALHTDAVWALGGGVYRHVDLVIGCLDNLEARMTVNKGCWRANKIWIDGGLWELSGTVAVFDASTQSACYECSMTDAHYEQAKQRYSCTNNTVKTMIKQGYAPTTQTISAIIGAIQCQEAVKILHDLDSFTGNRLVFNGLPHFYTDPDLSPLTLNTLTLNNQCLCHGEERYHDVVELKSAKATQTTPRQLIELVESHSGKKDLTLEIGRTFVIEAVCDQCQIHLRIERPLYLVKDMDAVCPNCAVICPSCDTANVGRADCSNCGQANISELQLTTFHTLANQDALTHAFLDKPLAELGVPPLHVLTLTDPAGFKIMVELTGDLPDFNSIPAA